MRDHHRSVYRELLRQFRDGFAKYSGAVFCLEAIAPQEEPELNEAHKQSIIELAGTVNSPEGCIHVYVVVGGLVNYPDKAVYARQAQLCRDAWQVFRPLAEQAGSHLPPAVRDSLSAEPGTAISYWFNVLYWHLLPHLGAEEEGDTDAGVAVHKRRLLSYSPFQHSAMAIEHLGLAVPPKRKHGRDGSAEAGANQGAEYAEDVSKGANGSPSEGSGTGNQAGGFWSVPDITREFSLTKKQKNALQSRLRRWRKNNCGASTWQEVQDSEAGPRGSRFYYKLNAIRNMIEAVTK